MIIQVFYMNVISVKLIIKPRVINHKAIPNTVMRSLLPSLAITLKSIDKQIRITWKIVYYYIYLRTIPCIQSSAIQTTPAKHSIDIKPG